MFKWTPKLCQRKDNSKIPKYIDFFLNSSSTEPLGEFQTTWHKASPLNLKFVPMKNHINIHIQLNTFITKCWGPANLLRYKRTSLYPLVTKYPQIKWKLRNIQNFIIYLQHKSNWNMTVSVSIKGIYFFACFMFDFQKNVFIVKKKDLTTIHGNTYLSRCH